MILAAAILHVMITVGVFATGALQLMASQIAPNRLAASLPMVMFTRTRPLHCVMYLGVRGSARGRYGPTQLHVRLYSLPLVVFYRSCRFSVWAEHWM